VQYVARRVIRSVRVLLFGRRRGRLLESRVARSRDVPREEREARIQPGPAVYHGHEGVRRWHTDIADAFGGEIRLEPEAFFDVGEHTISFHVLHGRGQQSGADVATPAAYLCRWRGGRIVYFKGYLDREDAFRDLGVSGEARLPIAP
jgi:ketosteroid isomerase-like protein